MYPLSCLFPRSFLSPYPFGVSFDVCRIHLYRDSSRDQDGFSRSPLMFFGHKAWVHLQAGRCSWPCFVKDHFLLIVVLEHCLVLTANKGIGAEFDCRDPASCSLKV